MTEADFVPPTSTETEWAEKNDARVSPQARRVMFRAFADRHPRPDLADAPLQVPEERTRQIGFLNEGGWIDFRVGFVSQVVSGIYEGCYTTGNSLVLHTPPKQADSNEKYARLVGSPVDGLIVKTLRSDPIVPLLRDSPLAVVAIVDLLPGIPSVTSDDAAGGRAIAEHLAVRGHRRVFFQQSDVPHESVARRLAALRDATPWDLAVEVGSVPNSEPGGMCDALIAALSRPSEGRPTAVVCWNDRNAASVLTACRQKGLRVPSDLAVVGYDDGGGDGGTLAEGRRITSVRAEWGAVARAAVYCLTTLLNGESVPEETVLPCRLVVGDTT